MRVQIIKIPHTFIIFNKPSGLQYGRIVKCSQVLQLRQHKSLGEIKKMKHQIIGLILIIGFSCNTKSVETNKKNNSDSLIEPALSPENNEKVLNEQLVNKRKDFTITMQKKGFGFSCYDKCEGDVGISLEELRKYGRRKPFDIKKKIVNDTLRIKFKFISDCCLEYIGDVNKVEDTLKLSYKNISYSPCDCYCYYYYEYFLPTDKYNSKFIYLGDSLITRNKKKK
jgi:hypothetical protein